MLTCGSFVIEKLCAYLLLVGTWGSFNVWPTFGMRQVALLYCIPIFVNSPT